MTLDVHHVPAGVHFCATRYTVLKNASVSIQHEVADTGFHVQIIQFHKISIYTSQKHTVHHYQKDKSLNVVYENNRYLL